MLDSDLCRDFLGVRFLAGGLWVKAPPESQKDIIFFSLFKKNYFQF